MSKKLEDFIKRNRKRNAHLYDIGMIEGLDYVLCPVSNERMVMITTQYIQNVLQISVGDFLEKFPNVQRTASARATRIATAMQETDENGQTVRDARAERIKKTKMCIGDDGVSIAQRAAKKASVTRSTVTENGYTNAQNAAFTAIINGNITKQKLGKITISQSHYEWYAGMVAYLLNREYGNASKSLNVKISDGFAAKLPPFVLARRENIMMTEQTNNDSHSKMSTETLLNTIGLGIDEAEAHYAEFVKACEWCMTKNNAISFGLVAQRIKHAGIST